MKLAGVSLEGCGWAPGSTSDLGLAVVLGAPFQPRHPEVGADLCLSVHLVVMSILHICTELLSRVHTHRWPSNSKGFYVVGPLPRGHSQ